MIDYRCLQIDNKTPKVGKLYRLVINGEGAPPIIVEEISDKWVGYTYLEQPGYMQYDTLEQFINWYGEW